MFSKTDFKMYNLLLDIKLYFIIKYGRQHTIKTTCPSTKSPFFTKHTIKKLTSYVKFLFSTNMFMDIFIFLLSLHANLESLPNKFIIWFFYSLKCLFMDYMAFKL